MRKSSVILMTAHVMKIMWGVSGRACSSICVAILDIALRPKRRNALHSTPELRRRNCAISAGRFGGVAQITPMRGVQTGIDGSRRCLLVVTSIPGWMVRYGRDSTDGQEGGGSRGGYLADPE
jgi:hypothetical protein